MDCSFLYFVITFDIFEMHYSSPPCTSEENQINVKSWKFKSQDVELGIVASSD